MVYVHGGFEHEIPNIPLSEICKIDVQKLLSKHENLLSKIKPQEKNGKDADKDKKDKKDGIKKNNANMYTMDKTFKLAQ